MRICFAVLCFLAPLAFGDPDVVLTAPSRAYPNFFVGDNFTLSIYGATPDALVQIYAIQFPPSQDPVEYGTTSFGNTNGSGEKEITGTFDEWTLGNWVEVVYVNGLEIGTLEFGIQEPPEECTVSASGQTMFFSLDSYNRYTGDRFTYTDPTTLYHNVTSGPCTFTSGEVSGGTWINGSYSDSDDTSRTWTVTDSLAGQTVPLPYSICYEYYPRCAYTVPAPDPVANYPVVDYAIVSSTYFNSQSMTGSTLNSYVTLWIDGEIQ